MSMQIRPVSHQRRITTQQPPKEVLDEYAARLCLHAEDPSFNHRNALDKLREFQQVFESLSSSSKKYILNEYRQRGDTILQLACRKNEVCLVQFLLSCSETNPNIGDQSPLNNAIRIGNVKCVKLLLEDKRTEINQTRGLKNQDFIDAAKSICSRDEYDQVLELLLARPELDVNIQDDRGNFASWYIIEKWESGDFAFLLSRQDFGIHQRLELAFAFDFEFAKKLFMSTHYKKVNHQNAAGFTLLHCAALSNNEKAVEFLLKIPEIKVDILDACGLTPAHYTENSRISQLLLIRPDFPINACSRIQHSRRRNTLVDPSEGVTPLHIASSRGDLASVLVILEREDVNLNKPVLKYEQSYLSPGYPQGKPKELETSICLAAKKGYESIAIVLLSDPRTRLRPRDINDLVKHCFGKKKCFALLNSLFNPSVFPGVFPDKIDYSKQKSSDCYFDNDMNFYLNLIEEDLRLHLKLRERSFFHSLTKLYLFSEKWSFTNLILFKKILTEYSSKFLSLSEAGTVAAFPDGLDYILQKIRTTITRRQEKIAEITSKGFKRVIKPHSIVLEYLEIPVEDCSICYDVQSFFLLPSKSIALKCNHIFHRSCIESWILKSNTCPLCRDRVITPFL